MFYFILRVKIEQDWRSMSQQFYTTSSLFNGTFEEAGSLRFQASGSFNVWIMHKSLLPRIFRMTQYVQLCFNSPEIFKYSQTTNNKQQNSKWDPKKVVVVSKCLLFWGSRKLRFDCSSLAWCHFSRLGNRKAKRGEEKAVSGNSSALTKHKLSQVTFLICRVRCSKKV